VNAPVSTQLSGDGFASAMISGIHRVIDNQELLNQINVFPVPDGDTGTNLSLSLGAALPVLQQSDEKHLGTLLASVADALLDGARGNSGAIVAQFFQGMSDSAGELNRFTPHSFAKAVVMGCDYAHDAMSNPREGTILSVITVFAASVDDHNKRGADGGFPALIRNALEESQQALAKTQEQLEVLRKAGVVDAGAKGFVELLDGMNEYLSTGNIVAEPDLSLISIEAPLVTVGSSLESGYRFCTECIVTGTDIDRRKLREALADLGDSLVLAGTKRKAKLHIHVDEPERVFDVARQYGHVSAEKADDMRRQQTSSHDANRRFAVITDSAADIPDEDMERLDIHMVPCRIQFGERGYLDKVSITASEFFEELRSNPHHPTTSQPAPGDFRRQYQFLASHFADVLSINLTGMASGTLEAARSAAERVNAHGRVHVVNSRNASLGQGLLVVAAAEYAKAGLSVQDAIAAVEKLIPDTRTYGLLKDLRFAVRGGRVPRWVKTIAELLRATAIIRTVPDGRVASGTFLFGRNAQVVRQHSPHHHYGYRCGTRRTRRTGHVDRGHPALFAPDRHLALQHFAVRLDEFVAFVAGVVDAPVHRPGPQPGTVPDGGIDQLVVAGEPAFGALGIEDHRHTMMQLCKEIVCLCRKQRRGLQ
jgi:DegV family protein with EDD domain